MLILNKAIKTYVTSTWLLVYCLEKKNSHTKMPLLIELVERDNCYILLIIEYCYIDN
jgi:hypothetical protein